MPKNERQDRNQKLSSVLRHLMSAGSKCLDIEGTLRADHPDLADEMLDISNKLAVLYRVVTEFMSNV